MCRALCKLDPEIRHYLATKGYQMVEIVQGKVKALNRNSGSLSSF